MIDIKRKIITAYIINSIISGLYIIRGLFTVISAQSSNTDMVHKLISAEIFSRYSEWTNLIYEITVKILYVIDIIKLYVYGYPSLLIGFIAIAFSSMATFFFTQKITKATVEYYVFIIISYFLLALLTLIYIIAGIHIF